MVTDYILGGSSLHDRLCAMAEILGKLVSSAPRSVSIAQLEEATGRPAKELTKLCASLWRAELLVPDPDAGQRWNLACEPSMVTLEDVFRCIVSEQQERSKPAAKLSAPERAFSDVDLLVTQAMLAVNQSVFKNLRQFSLDRLKASGAGMFPASTRRSRHSYFDDANDITLANRETHPISPTPQFV